MKNLIRLLLGAMLLVMACNLGSPAAPTDLPPAPTEAVESPTAAPAGPEPVVVSGAGDITANVEQYRALLGADNGGDLTQHPDGRREINWDAIPDELASPNDYPSDFFNGTSAPQARGIVLTSPGGTLRVSADSDNPTGTPPRFGDINATYVDTFQTFSPERLFSPVGSNIVEATFFVPGTQVPALVRGFGAVYTDVDTDHTAFEYFDQNGQSLGKFNVPIADKGLSFLGVTFDQPVVAKVRIEYGTVALGPDDDATNDVAVMDDFIFGEPQPIDPNALAAQPTAAAGPTFTLIANAVNRDVTQAAQSPFLTLAGDTGNPWITWAENSSGNLRQIFVSELVNGAFEPRGTTLNLHQNVIADQPSITFTGENKAVPWVAWVEPSPGFDNITQIFASRFNAATGLWQPAGQDRGGAEPSLNFQTNHGAARPFIFGGSTEAGGVTVPWVAWEERGTAFSAIQIFVAKAVKDDTAIGGFRWDFVGQLRHDEPSLNIDQQRDAFHPVGVFAETGNSVPWVTWHESGGDRPGRIFTARGVVDANAPGGLKWINVPPCTPDEVACSLNVNPLKDANDAAMAAGSVTPGESSVPWIVWAEVGPTGKYQILVSRLDPSTRNSFLNVGGSLNVDQNHDAKQPFITFVGTVPYVVWLEDDGTGKFEIQMRHLSSDPQTGTWTLDTPAKGFNANGEFSDFGLSVTASDLITMAWVEGDPLTTAAQLVLGQFKP